MFFSLPVGGGCSALYNGKFSCEKNKRKDIYKSTKKAKKERSAEEIAQELMLFNCDCKKTCLLRIDENWQVSKQLLVEYVTPWLNMDRNEHRQKFYSLLEGCAKGVTSGGHLEKRYLCLFTFV